MVKIPVILVLVKLLVNTSSLSLSVSINCSTVPLGSVILASTVDTPKSSITVAFTSIMELTLNVTLSGLMFVTEGTRSYLNQSNMIPSVLPLSASMLFSRIPGEVRNVVPSHMRVDTSSSLSIATIMIASVLGCSVNRILLISLVAKFDVFETRLKSASPQELGLVKFK